MIPFGVHPFEKEQADGLGGEGDQDEASLNLWFLGDQSDQIAAEIGGL